MLKQWTAVWLFALVTLVLAGCSSASGAPAAAPAPQAVASALDISYTNALPLRNQLLLGTLRLEESNWPISAEQAGTLVPLWQGIRGTLNSGASAQAEIDALLHQIESTLSPEQISAIGALKLTQTELQAWATSQGLSVGTGEGAAAGQGSGQSLSPEARATRQAERGVTGEGGGLSTALLDAVIGLLEAKA
jgi:hypothetical protein